jgi:hypothetical protein
MMPDIEREERRRKRAPVMGFILIISFLTAALFSRFYPDVVWVPLAVGVVAATAVGVTIDPPDRRGRGNRRLRGSGVAAGHPHDDDVPLHPATDRPRLLILVSWLMPRTAGRRWLAEAESLLAEIAPARHGPAHHSYLLSAPSLIAIMWAHAVLRRARPRPQRPH